MRPNYFRQRELTFCDAVKMHKTDFIQGYTDTFWQRDSSKRIFDLDRSRRSGPIREIPKQARDSGSGCSDRIFRRDGGRLGGQPVRDVRRHVGEKRRQFTFGNFQLLSARQTVSGFSALNPSFSYD